VYTPAPTFSSRYVSVAAVVNVKPTISTLTVLLNLTQPVATVSCFALLHGASSTAVITTSSYVAVNGISVTTGRYVASVILAGLYAHTEYDVYCSTVSATGSTMPLSQIQKKVVSATTSCCKQVSLSLTSKSYFVSTVTQSAIVISFNAPPSGTMSVELSTTAVGSVSLYPSSITLGSAATDLSYSIDLVTYSAAVSQVALSVSFSGETGNYSTIVLYPTGNVISIVTNDQQPVPPSMVSATFSADGSYINVAFGTATDKAGYVTCFPCVNLFSFGDRLASEDNNTCIWLDPLTVQVYVGYYGNRSVSVGDSVTLLGSELRAACPTGVGKSICKQWNTSAADAVIIAAPLSPQVPEVYISMPTSIGGCSDISIDFSASTGHGGRNWSSAMIAVTVASVYSDTVNLTESKNAFESYFLAHYTLYQVFTIPRSVLKANVTYTISCTLCSFLDTCGESTASVSVLGNTNSPVVTIAGASVVSVDRSQTVSLLSTAHLGDCGGKLLYSSVSGYWSVTLDGGEQSQLVSTSRNSKAFRLSPYSLVVNQQYSIVYTAKSLVDGSTASASVRVNVHSAGLLATISGGAVQSARVLVPFELDGSGSMDADIGNSTGLSFQWACVQLSPTYSTSCVWLEAVYGLSDADTLSLVASSISAVNSSSSVSLVVSKGDNKASAKVSVVVVSASTASVSISSTQSLTQIDIGNRLVLSAQVNTSATSGCDSVWALDDASFDLAAVARTSTTLWVPSSTQYTFNLVLPPSSLSAPSILTFSLICGEAVASIVVDINSPPRPGSFVGSPAQGHELSTSFRLSAIHWVDAQLPMSFEFGFASAAGAFLTVCSQAATSSCATILPAGSEQTGYSITMQAYIYDNLGASTAASTTLIVFSMNQSNFDAVLSEQLAYAEGDIDSLKQILSSGLSFINKVNCSGATPAVCASLNRLSCSDKAFTCGSCQDSYIGDSGDANTMCITLEEFAFYQYNETDVSTTCSPSAMSSDCGPWSECSEDGSCVRLEKPSPHCENDGTAEYVLVDSGLATPICYVGDPACQSICSCSAFGGFSGTFCDTDDTSVSIRQGQIDLLMNQLAQLTSTEDDEESSVTNWIANMALITTSSLNVANSSVNNLTALASTVLSAAINANVAYTDAALFIDVIDGSADVISSVSSSFSHGFSMLTLLSQYGEYIGDQLVEGEISVQSMGSLVRLSTIIQSGGNVSTTAPQSVLQSVWNMPSASASLALQVGDETIRSSIMTVKGSVFESDNETNMKSDVVQFHMFGSFDDAETVTFNFPHYQDVRFHESIDQNISFATTCSGMEAQNYSYSCPLSDVTIVHNCKMGVSATYTTACPSVYLDFSCASLSEDASMACVTVNVTATSITCQCSLTNLARRRQLESSNGVGLVSTVVSTTVYFSGEVGATLMAAQSFNSLSSVRQVLIVITIFGVLWAGGLSIICTCVIRREHGKSSMKRVHTAKHEVKKHAAKHHHHAQSLEQIRDHLLGYCAEVLPSAFRDMSRAIRVRDELMKHHRYVLLFSSKGIQNDRERILTGIQLLTVQTMLVFLLAVFYDLQAPDDNGTCPTYLTESSCLAKKSPFNAAQTYCQWASVPGDAEVFACKYWQPNLSLYTIAVMSVLVSMVTAVVNYPVDRFFDILSAPLADSIKVKNSESTLNRVGRRLSNAARRASNAAVTAVNTAIQKVERLRNVSLVGFVTLNIPETTQTAHDFAAAAVNDVKGRVDEIIEARQSKLVASLRYSKSQRFKLMQQTGEGDYVDHEGKDSDDSDNEQNQIVSADLSEARRLSVQARTSPLRGWNQAERELNTRRLNELDTVHSASGPRIIKEFGRLVDEIDRQRHFLAASEQEHYDRHWGIDPSGEFSTQYFTGVMNFRGKRDISETIRTEMAFATNTANKKIKKLALATDDHAGLEILHLFILDLLGRDTPVAKIFQSKSSEDFKAETVVTRRYKALAWACLVFLNLFFVYYTILRGYVKGEAWQRSFMFGCLVQFCVEVMFNETLECLWVNFVVPDLASTEVRKAAAQLESVVEDICVQTSKPRAANYFLDSCSYLFVSSKVANQYPNLIESMLVLSYSNHLPGELSRKWKIHASHATSELLLKGFGFWNMDSATRRKRLAAMSASLIAVLVLGLQVLGASPFVLQRMIIRLSQPWLLALITLACTNISRRPEYVVAFVVILLIVVYFVAVRKSNKVVAEEAVVIPEVDIDDDDKELSNTHSAKSLHSGAEVAVGGVDAIRSEYSHSSHDDENDDEADHFDHNLLGSTDADGEDVPIDLPMGDFDEEVKVGSSFHIPLDHRNSSNSRKEARDNWSDASRSSKTLSDGAVERVSDRSYYSRNGKDSRSGSGSRSRSHNDSSSFTSSYNISQKESSISLSEEEPDVNKINGPNRAGGSRRSSSRDDRQSASRSASASASSESAYGIVGPRARSESHTDSDSDSDSENSKESDHPVFHYKDHAHDSSRGHSESGQSSSSGSSTGDSDIESVHSEVVGPRGTY
jgi:hypothetical protein